MTLEEAIRVLGIQGYPSNLKLEDMRRAIASLPKGDAKVVALGVVDAFLSRLYDESAELREAHKLIEWGPGSTTEYQEWNAQYAHVSSLEEREAEKRGGPKGPTAKPKP